MLERMYSTICEESQQTDYSNPAERNSDGIARAKKGKSIKNIRVCAMCTNCPALSKYSNASPEDMEIVEKLQELEAMVENGVHSDGNRLTLREIKGLERKIEKLQVELKERKKKRVEKSEEGIDEEEEQNGHGQYSEIEDEDPFLKATGGNALVGGEYQEMLLTKSLQ